MRPSVGPIAFTLVAESPGEEFVLGVRCGDPATRRRFLRYWRLIRPGSGLIRGSLLRYIRRLAEGHGR